MVALYGGLFWAPLLATILLLLAVFPTGRVLSPGWRVIWLLAAGFVVLAVLANGFGAEIEDLGLANPYPVAAIDRLGIVWIWLSGVCLIGAAALGIASMVVRFRRGAPVERLQIKWFLAAAAGFPPAIVLVDVTGQSPLGTAVLGAVLIGLVVAIVIAVLRYRLYEIDRLISRTLSYTIVTGLLVGVFAVIVVVPTAVAGGEETPSWVVAGATLAVAGLFTPLRRRVQVVVDRRFNRSRYDAQRVADGFAARLRDPRDLEAVTADLVGTVNTVVQPSTVAVWVRGVGS